MNYENMTKELAVLLSIIVISAFTVNYLSPKGIALFGEWDTSKGVITAKAKDDHVVRDLEIEAVLTAREMYDTGNYLFVDARHAEYYSEGHIKGAVLLPVGEFYDHIERFMMQYPSDTPIITYCTGRECDDSHKVAQYLSEEGYTNVSVFIDGYPAWEEEGHPVEYE